MKLPLKDFQSDAIRELVQEMHSAARESRTGSKKQAVSLSSATGSGKTVMLTRAIEIMLQGDEENPPVGDATFLWITDQPELNEQTRRKMLATSSVLGTENLVVIDATYNDETLRAGAVHFLNTQKLGKNSGLVSRSDNREYTIWTIIANTIEARPGKFFVIVDEAHRGMTEEKGQAEATTIIQKFIKGSPGEIEAVPIIVGISATPDRFQSLIAGTKRNLRPIEVDVEEVRLSGLIKDTIVLHHPKKEQASDITMLREAAKSLKKFTADWSSYCAAQEEFTVEPLLVVQVQDSNAKGQLSQTDIEQAMGIVRDTLGGEVTRQAFAHSFMQGETVKIGGEELRYLAPPDIQDDPDVRVVFFKTSLNTGWDCPRAEVMMSFRRAEDYTYIAQLVGRMVRTPLARRIRENETLNTVSLYLPEYDTKSLKKVTDRLSKPDDNTVPPIDLEEGDDVAELTKAPRSAKAFEALELLPSSLVPYRRRTNQVRRLMKFSRLLTNDEIDVDASATAEEELLGVLNSDYKEVSKTRRFKQLVEERAKIEIEAVDWPFLSDELGSGQTIKVDIASENVEDLFEATGRKLTEGLHMKWWRKKVARGDAAAREKAKLELFALCISPELLGKFEKKAEDIVKKWLRTHGRKINSLDEGKQARYEEIRGQAGEPEPRPLQYPGTVHLRTGDREWDKHLYVDADGKFSTTMNDSEQTVLEEELSARGVVGWVRNVDRKDWALCVPYETDGQWKSLYPDFLIVRKDGTEHVVDLVDPHSLGISDAVDKAIGLAKFAEEHESAFGKIEMILIQGKKTKRIDLCNEKYRRKIKRAKGIETLQELMDED